MRIINFSFSRLVVSGRGGRVAAQAPLSPAIETKSCEIIRLYLGYRNRKGKDDKLDEECFVTLLMSGIETGKLSSRKCVGMIGAETFFEILER